MRSKKALEESYAKYSPSERHWVDHFKGRIPNDKEILKYLHSVPYEKIAGHKKHWKLCSEGPWAISSYGDFMLVRPASTNALGKLYKFRPVGAKLPHHGTVMKVNKVCKMYFIHRLVAKYFLPLSSLPVTHMNRNFSDNTVWNLKHMTLKALMRFHADNGGWGLGPEREAFLIEKIKEGWSKKYLNRTYKVSWHTIMRLMAKHGIEQDDIIPRSS